MDCLWCGKELKTLGEEVEGSCAECRSKDSVKNSTNGGEE